MSYQIGKTGVDARSTGANALLKTVLLIAAGNLLLVASARVTVPFWPVPLTLETFAVLLIAATYRWRLATATMVLFLAEGAFGLPVFTGGGGPLYIMGPTGGYLLGYLLATILVGYLTDHGWKRNTLRLAGAMLLGEVLILGIGYAWLGSLIGYDKAIVAGVTPFIFGDLVKIALAASTVSIGRDIVRRLS
ncbi:MAG: biotin transporter BioY [Candidimonas sp.]|nr:MAG: biotin transporter BioY [Candidimonas sp.]